jgi:hypothetical protein
MEIKIDIDTKSLIYHCLILKKTKFKFLVCYFFLSKSQ